MLARVTMLTLKQPRRFADVLVRRNQRQWVDFTKFDDTVPLGEHGSIDQQEVSQRLAQHTISERHLLAC